MMSILSKRCILFCKIAAVLFLSTLLLIPNASNSQPAIIVAGKPGGAARNHFSDGERTIHFFSSPIISLNEKQRVEDASEYPADKETIRQIDEEAEKIKKCAAGKVQRKSNELLEFSLGNGKKLQLQNSNEGGEDQQVYTFDGCLNEISAWLVDVMGWEVSGAMLISKMDGTKTNLSNTPQISPDKKRFICYRSGEDEAGYYDNYIEIWTVTNGKFKKEKEFSGLQWGPVSTKWVSNTSIQIEAEKFNGVESKKLKSKILNLLNGKWTVK